MVPGGLESAQQQPVASCAWLMWAAGQPSVAPHRSLRYIDYFEEDTDRDRCFCIVQVGLCAQEGACCVARKGGASVH